LRHSPVTIQAVVKEDIALLEANMPFGGSEKHVARLARQNQGKVDYFIAWYDGVPVGHVLVKWDAAEKEPAASSLIDTPDIEDLRVHSDYHRRGIGLRLLTAAEKLAAQRGYTQVGLSCGVGNVPARALYDRLGYIDAGLGQFVIHGSYVDTEGTTRVWEETCVYMVKSLDCPS
jgi:ribosomal protein S18 acetylase RimI-like enzyme